MNFVGSVVGPEIPPSWANVRRGAREMTARRVRVVNIYIVETGRRVDGNVATVQKRE